MSIEFKDTVVIILAGVIFWEYGIDEKVSDDTVAIKGPVQEGMRRIFDKEIDDMGESSEFEEWVFIDFMILDGFEAGGIFF